VARADHALQWRTRGCGDTIWHCSRRPDARKQQPVTDVQWRREGQWDTHRDAVTERERERERQTGNSNGRLSSVTIEGVINTARPAWRAQAVSGSRAKSTSTVDRRSLNVLCFALIIGAHIYHAPLRRRTSQETAGYALCSIIQSASGRRHLQPNNCKTYRDFEFAIRKSLSYMDFQVKF